MSSFRPSSLLSITLMLFFLAACGEPTAHTTSFDDAGRTDSGDRDGDRDNQGSEYSLRLLTEGELEAHIGSAIDLRVQLLQGESPVLNQALTYQLISTPGHPDTRLEAQSIYVNDQGIAPNRLRIGDLVGLIHVRVSHPWVNNPLDIHIDVTTTPEGDIQVALNHPTQDLHALTDFEVKLWPTGVVSCQSIPPYVNPVDPADDESHLTDLFQTALFADLLVTDTYTVGVKGMGSHGQISAVGCVDGIEIIPDGVAEVVIDLELLPLLPQGEYDVTSFWDFSEALASSGSVGAAIVGLLDWLADPAGMLTDTLLGLAEDWVCDTYGWDSWECLGASWGSSAIRDDVRDFLNDQIQSVGFLAEITNIGNDLRDTVSNMKVESILTVDSKSIGESELEGRDSWRAMYFYWTRSCDANSPPDCGEIRIGLGDGSDFGALESRWEGRLYDYNQLEIDPHDMTIPYGRVITYILNNHIIPGLTGGNANNLGQALDYWICSGLGGFSLFGITIPASTVQSLCSTAVATLNLATNIYLNNLTYSIDLFMSGVGTVVDLESNGIVDRIEDGFFLGQLYGEDGSSTDMESFFTAERR